MLVKSTSGGDAKVDKALRDLQTEIRGRSFADGARLLEGIELKAGTSSQYVNRIAHGLGRRPSGLIVVGQRNVLDRRVIACVDFEPATDASWTKPNLGTSSDFYVATAGVRIHYPIHVAVGERIKEVRMLFYRNGATNPTNKFLYRAATEATANTVTPTVAWTNPTVTGAWQEIYASYDEYVQQADYVGSITANNAGDKVRAAFVTVESGRLSLENVSADRTDADKFLYLHTANLSAEVDLLVF